MGHIQKVHRAKLQYWNSCECESYQQNSLWRNIWLKPLITRNQIHLTLCHLTKRRKIMDRAEILKTIFICYWPTNELWFSFKPNTKGKFPMHHMYSNPSILSSAEKTTKNPFNHRRAASANVLYWLQLLFVFNHGKNRSWIIT